MGGIVQPHVVFEKGFTHGGGNIFISHDIS
jgi:hypothetical protein